MDYERSEKYTDYLFRLLINQQEKKETGFAKEFLENLRK